MLDCAHTTKMQMAKVFSLFVAIVLLTAIDVRSQRERNPRDNDDTPAMKEFRGVSIGMTADEVRKKLGTPTDKGDEQDFFIFNDNETAQVIYGKDKKVVALSFDFMSGASNIPSPKSVFGSDVQAKSDGSIYKRVSYPKVGYWLSYNRTAGEGAMISLTFQRLEH